MRVHCHIGECKRSFAGKWALRALGKHTAWHRKVEGLSITTHDSPIRAHDARKLDRDRIQPTRAHDDELVIISTMLAAHQSFAARHPESFAYLKHRINEIA